MLGPLKLDPRVNTPKRVALYCQPAPLLQMTDWSPLTFIVRGGGYGARAEGPSCVSPSPTWAFADAFPRVFGSSGWPSVGTRRRPPLYPFGTQGCKTCPIEFYQGGTVTTCTVHPSRGIPHGNPFNTCCLNKNDKSGMSALPTRPQQNPTDLDPGKVFCWLKIEKKQKKKRGWGVCRRQVHLVENGSYYTNGLPYPVNTNCPA